jgi:hypothetical protein
MAARDQMEILLGRLIGLTREAKLEWRRSVSAPASYEVLTDSGSKIVIDSRDDDGGAPFDLVVYDSEGEEVSELPWGGHDSTSYQLETLHQLVKEHIAGTSKILDQVLAELPQEEDIPF